MSQHDDINRPKHYELAPGIEAWDVIRAVLTPEELRGYCLGNVLKYRLRAGEKEGQDPTKCLAKARWYRERLVEIEEKKRDSLDRHAPGVHLAHAPSL